MKNIYYIFILFLFCFFSDTTQAQHMDTPGNQWNISESQFGQPNSYAIRVAQDTVINGVEYHKLLRSTDGEEPWIFNGALIREDSSQKVFYRNGSSEELIYDFNLAINDTVFFEFEIPQCENMIVEAIDSIALNDESVRKRLTIRINYGNDFFGTDYWIAGVGSTFFGSFSYIDNCRLELGSRLLCFFEDGDLAYPETPENCVLSNTEETLFQNNIQIYPNPVSDQLKIIDVDQQLTSFEIFNLTGKLIKRGTINSTDQTVSLENIRPGMYLLSLRTKAGTKLVKKILKR